MIAPDDSLPPVPAWFQNGFHRFFLRSFLKRHFHSLAIDRQSRCEASLQTDLPLIVYGNHPSWWDPLVAHYLNRMLFSQRQFYAPIDADALDRYRVFAKLGFYGVRLNTISGAGKFLNQSLAIATAPNTALWITPEGRFADPRDHTATLMPGLAHLCTRMDDGWVLPLTLEYVFWQERLPECLALIGEPIRVAEHKLLSKTQWQECLTNRLRLAQDALSRLAIARSSEPFDNLLPGNRGAGFLYDSWRRLTAFSTRTKFRSAHGDAFE